MPNDSYSGLFYNHGKFSVVTDVLAVEESLSISLNDTPFTVTMRSPGDETELIRGLLFTEEVYRDDAAPVIEIREKNGLGFITSVNVTVPAHAILKDFAGTRNMISASSCGLCGRTSFEDTVSKNLISYNGVIDPEIVFRMFEMMGNRQFAFQQSGGTHASAAFTADGTLIDCREDIGRHNAVDKVIGSLIISGKRHEAVCLTVSGRISYEIVNKALSAGIPIVASVSAPSTMAVRNADAAGMTLMAFCRKDKLTVYTHPERLLQGNSLPVNR